MKRRGFVVGSASAVAASSFLGLPACGASSAQVLTPAIKSKIGQVFLSQVNTITTFPDRALYNLIKQTAASNPSPQQVEVALALLGGYAGSPPQFVPTPIPPAAALSFPADHGEHFDMQIEWRYITLSLPLSNGGLASVIANFFRKSIATATTAPTLAPIDRQVYSTSIAVTIEMPGKPGVHYALPTTTFAPIDGTVAVTNNPFSMRIGSNSLTGTSSVFPLHVHIEDAGDSTRPPIVIDVDCANTNPLFLQGQNGYVGPDTKPGEVPSVGWRYYSWPQQKTTGTVSIAGTNYGVSGGLAWMDHQFGGSPVVTSGPVGSWSGWCWFEFQFSGNRSLTLAAPHGPVPSGVLPADNSGFGTYIENGVSSLVACDLKVPSYVASPSTTARYPSAWSIDVRGTGILLNVVPRTTVEPQALWMGQLAEYSEASATATATGTVGGAPVTMQGVGYCEGVGFEDPAAEDARQTAFLQANLRH